MFSALKRDGQALYALARQGIEVERPPRAITIHALALLGVDAASLTLEVRCSKGTYIRTLGEDIAVALGTCGHLSALRRTVVGAFDGQALHDFAALEALAGDEAALDACLLPVDAALGTLPKVALTSGAAAAFRHGQRLAWPAPADGRVRVYDEAGDFIGLGLATGGGTELVPDRLMSTAEP
jgi:tRNA pseudouridine55 synthase